MESPAGKQIWNLLSESESDRDLWYSTLRNFAYCCPKCSLVHGYSTESESNRHLMDTTSGFRQVRSVSIGVVEAKDVSLTSSLTSSSAVSRGFNLYFKVFLDEIKMARTSTKQGDAPFWGETFMLSYDFLSCFTFDYFLLYSTYILVIFDLISNDSKLFWFTIIEFNVMLRLDMSPSLLIPANLYESWRNGCL
jgi:hypothetical protein